MKKILIVMRDDKGGPSVMVTECGEGAKDDEIKETKRHVRSAIAAVLTLTGKEVLEASSGEDLSRELDEREDEIGTVIVMQQGADDYESLRHLEMVRSRCGSRIAVIGLAESIRCMEEMASRRVDALIGAPLGVLDLEAILRAVGRCSNQ